jgi:hypothetical protein
LRVSPPVFSFGGLEGFLAMLFALFGFVESLVFVNLFSLEQKQAASLFVDRDSSGTGTGWSDKQHQKSKSKNDSSFHWPGFSGP